MAPIDTSPCSHRVTLYPVYLHAFGIENQIAVKTVLCLFVNIYKCYCLERLVVEPGALSLVVTASNSRWCNCLRPLEIGR